LLSDFFPQKPVKFRRKALNASDDFFDHREVEVEKRLNKVE